MKRNYFLFLSVFATAILLSLNSCKKVEPTSLELDMSKSGTIKGYVFAQLDEMISNDTIPGSENPREYAPSGTKVFVNVDNNQYINLTAPGTKTYEATVDANGMFSIDIPADENGVNVTVIFDEFVYDYKTASWDFTQTPARYVYDETEQRIFSKGDEFLTIYPGKSEHLSVEYSSVVVK